MTGDLEARFDDLQRKLVPLWASIASLTDHAQTIVVVPSIPTGLLPPAVIPAYEERYLFMLLLLRQSRATMIYLTSQPVTPSIADYYLDLLPKEAARTARSRLHLVSPQDASDGSLAGKLLARPSLLGRIRGLIDDPDRAHLAPFMTTEEELRLAVELGIPMYGAHPRHSALGTKSECRRLFREEGVALPRGREGLADLGEAAEAIVEMRADGPPLRRAIVKLNDGVSGLGNAEVDLEGLPAPGSPDEARAVGERVRALALESDDLTVEAYAEKLTRVGGVVEERVDGEDVRSPSVQMRVTPLGGLEVLSTHDQLLGGASGQSYLGARFPADPAYAAAITAEAGKIGARLVREGVLGRFGVDFVVVRRGGAWETFAIELNLRKGGTTHPFLTLQFLTDGVYDPERASFITPRGEEKAFVASDHVESPMYRGLTPEDLFEIADRRGIHFDRASQTGVVFHMMSALGTRGQTGLTAVANGPEAAEDLYEHAVAILDEETRDAYRPDA